MQRFMGLVLQHEEVEVDPELGIDEEMVQALERPASGNAAVGLALGSAPGSVRMSLEFVGGHAEFIREPEASKLLATLRTRSR